MRLPHRGRRFERITYHAKVTQCLGGLQVTGPSRMRTLQIPVPRWVALKPGCTAPLRRPAGDLVRDPSPAASTRQRGRTPAGRRPPTALACTAPGCQQLRLVHRLVWDALPIAQGGRAPAWRPVLPAPQNWTTTITSHPSCLQPVSPWFLVVARPTLSVDSYPKQEDLAAFRIPHGVFVKLHKGTWHAGGWL